MSVNPELPNTDGSRWYKLMEAKGEAWNHFADEYGFEVNGMYQHYYCRVEGQIEVAGAFVSFSGERKYVDVTPSILFDRFEEFLLLTVNLDQLLGNENFIRIERSLGNRFRLLRKGLKPRRFGDFLEATNSPELASIILDRLALIIDDLEYAILSDKVIQIKLNYLPERDDDFAKIYTTLERLVRF